MTNQWKFTINNPESNDPDDWGAIVSDASNQECSDQAAPEELRTLMEYLGWEEVAESYFEHEDFTHAIETLKEDYGFIEESTLDETLE